MSVLISLFIIAALWLTVYGLNTWALTVLFLKSWRNTACRSPKPHTAKTTAEEKLPYVTVQLPIYNEALVAERLIDKVVQLDYPKQLLQIQILDDSTDETTRIASARTSHFRKQGFNIECIHRSDRTGFKAQALRQGLETATGEFVAIFDADFLPEHDFLRLTVPHLVHNPDLGFIQTRWEHINRDYSNLTAAQAVFLDGQFVVEHIARNRAGWFFNFNGTAGIWRRVAIETAGNWQSDTIFEDFDLSYRAQLAGWKGLYLPEVGTPAELPPQLAALKRQQFRWAKGTTQCLTKLGHEVWRASLPWPVKLQAFIHLGKYLLYPVMLVLAAITPILIITNSADGLRLPLMALPMVSLGIPFLYIVAQVKLFPNTWWQRYKALLTFGLTDTGLALSNTKAIAEAVLGVDNVFRRTPKFNVIAANDHWQNTIYRLPLDGLVLGEIILGVYFFWGAWIAAACGYVFALPMLLLYAFGCGYVSWQGLWEAHLIGAAQLKINQLKQYAVQVYFGLKHQRSDTHLGNYFR